MYPDPLNDTTVYETLFKSSHFIQLIIDPDDGAILDANMAAQKFYQYTRDELTGMTIFTINAMPRKQVEKQIQNVRQCRCNHFNSRHILKNNETREVEICSGPIEFRSRTVLYAIIHDITATKQAQKTLQKSEATIKAMIDATNSLVYLVDTKGKIINLNKSGANLFGMTPEQMTGKNFKSFLKQNDISRLTLLTDKVIQTGKALNYRKQINKKHYDVQLHPVSDDSGKITQICVFVNDISEIKKSERLLAAIETAGGICHEMNQPLQVILGNLELCTLNMKKNDPNLNLINTAMSHTQKLGNITKKLTNITRYETKEYIKGTILDIDRSSGIR